ncbi:MAG: flagellar hook-basal body complex protein [Amphritea sp.]|nr:flagellar hook-basal body complex protein [Amphritea sp.]
MAGFNTAVTGLKAATTDLDVTGNNIANSSTIGFKSSRTEFGDIYATAVVGAGSSNTPGSGVTVSDIAQDFSAGTIEFTNNNLDLAINGSGFFQLDDGKGGVTYSRAGAFELDKNGFVVSKSGKYLQGYGLDAQGNRLPIGNLAVTQKESQPKATENIDLSFNIDSRADAGKLLSPYSKDEPASFTYSTTLKSFDSLGNEHTIKFNFVEQRPVNETRTTKFAAAPAVAPAAFSVSGQALNLAADFGAAVGGLQTIDKTAPATVWNALQTADPRIRDVTYNPTTRELNVVLKSFATEYGDVVATSPTAGAVIDGTSTSTRASNEVHSFAFEADGAGAFDSSGQLTAKVEFTLGGVPFEFAAGTDKAAIGAEIAKKQSSIIDRNPEVQSVTFNSTTGAIDVTYRPELAAVADDLMKFSDDSALSVFNTTGSTPSTVYQGDNSYLGNYRTYAYLNGETQLELGKPNDPGESVTTSDDGPILMRFDSSNGLLTEVNGQTVVAGAPVPGVTIYGADPADPDTTIKLDLEGSTQFASASIVKQSQQDGYTKGDLIGVSFGLNGEMIASFSNGENQNLGVVAFATFENQAGLQPAGNTEWIATLTSGDAIMNPPGTGLNGTLRSAALEQSNVDLSTELVKLIEAQRNYQANSKTLETLNTVTQAILNI